jgi:DNA modification methylase
VNAGVDLAAMFKADEIAELLASVKGGDADAEPQIDQAEELNKKWRVKTGDLWLIGPHRLLCGDSTKATDVARVMGGEKADMVFTDPPYNVASEGRNYAADAPTQKKTYEALKEADWDKGFDIKPFLAVAESIMADDCAVYVCTSHWLVQTIWEWMWGWSKYCSYVVWCKPNPAPSLAKRHWTWATELIPYAVRGKHVCNFPAQGHALNWWDVQSGTHTEPHPTQKPTEIPRRAIAFSSAEGASVFDGFAGSGTTLVACENLGRKCRAVEISPAYCAVILERMAQAFPKLEITRDDGAN